MDERRLILMRHAKSDWSGGQDDFDRPINARGRLAAVLMGAWLAEGGDWPDTVLCSTAMRARQTLEHLSRLPGPAPQILEDDALYLASPARILATVRAAPVAARRLLVIGHNPGMEELVARLNGSATVDAMPTAAMAVFSVAAPWAELMDASARMTAFVRPKDLV